MICEVCENEFHGCWTDFYGEATCHICGAPYQLLEPSGATPNLKYPYLSLSQEWASVLGEYWRETGQICRLGMFLTGSYSGLAEEHKALTAWLRRKHPELLKKEAEVSP